MMAEQFDIFSRPGRVPAANADPDTSHAAAAQIDKSGLRAQQRRETLAALVRWLGIYDDAPTSAELAEGSVRLRYVYGRRLPDLADLGLVERRPKRTCGASGREAVTWWVTGAGRDALTRKP